MYTTPRYKVGKGLDILKCENNADALGMKMTI